VGAERLVAAEHELADLLGLEPADPLLGLVDQGEDVAGRGRQRAAGRGHGDASGVAGQQRAVELLLELLDGGGERRLCDAELLGRGGQVADLRDRTEVAEMNQVHARDHAAGRTVRHLRQFCCGTLTGQMSCWASIGKISVSSSMLLTKAIRSASCWAVGENTWLPARRWSVKSPLGSNSSSSVSAEPLCR